MFVIIILWILSPAISEIERFHHEVHISRKSRSYEDPIITGFVYNKPGSELGRMTKFNNTYLKPTEKYVDVKIKLDMDKNNTTECQENWRMKTKDKEVYSSAKQKDEHVKAKTKCLQLNRNDAPVAENIQPPIGITIKKLFTPYPVDKKFIIDNEDVRTDSRNSYNGWPYSYNGPYEYQNKKINTKNKNAKDKRYLGVRTTITPVRKNVIKNTPVEYISNAASATDPIIDNPIYGDQPFISFVLNDYFEKPNEEDPLIFKDFPWGEEFDNGISSQDIDDNERRSRWLHHNNNPNEIKKTDVSLMHTNTADKESVSKKAYDNSREYEKYRNNGYDKKYNEGLNQYYTGQRETAFKDFADSFANKFGSEESNKKSKFMLKTNQDKGQKRKGFKRVYHKDEYQEDNEFYDNINKNAESAENGASQSNLGKAQTVLQTQAVGSTGNEANSITKSGNKNSKIFENHYKVNDKNDERDNVISHYRNIAKDAAQSNNADYVDHFRI